MDTDDEPISLGKAYEMRYWRRQLQCTEGELLAAVQAVGSDRHQVAQYLAGLSAQERQQLAAMPCSPAD